MERKPYTRRDFLKTFVAVTGGVVASGGIAALVWNLFNQGEGASVTDSDQVDNSSVERESITLPKTTEIQDINSLPVEIPPIVDKFAIAEKVDFSNANPIKMLFITNDNRTILTPAAKPYPFTPENEKGNIFDWGNFTTYGYLDNHQSPIIWGHSGDRRTIFDYLVNDLLRIQSPKRYTMTRTEAESELKRNFIGSSVYILQAPDESLLPKNLDNLDFDKNLVNVVKLQVIAALFFPRFIHVDKIDKSTGDPTDDSIVVTDGNGIRTDWIARGYEKHTGDFYDWVKKAYSKIPEIIDQFDSLPTSDIIGFKTCMKAFTGDPKPKENDKGQTIDAYGNRVIDTSYGRFFMALKVIQ